MKEFEELNIRMLIENAAFDFIFKSHFDKIFQKDYDKFWKNLLKVNEQIITISIF